MSSSYLAIFVMGAAMTSGVSAAEKPVKMKDLPPAVQKTVQIETKAAKLIGLSEGVEGGKTMYEVETKVNGKSRDLIVDGAGAVVEVEQQVELASVPAPVRATIERAAAGAKIVKVESVTKAGAVSYEATINKGGKKSEVAIAGDGTVKK